MLLCFYFSVLFFFNDTATTEIYTLSLHDALPIFVLRAVVVDGDLDVVLLGEPFDAREDRRVRRRDDEGDRKSTRLNSSHSQISYAVFCLKKKTTFWTRRSLLRQASCLSSKSVSRP